MFKMFGKKAGEAKASLKKIENRNLLEAICAGSVLVMAADGEIEKAETISLEQIMRANDSVAHFGSEIQTTIQKFTDMVNAGGTTAKIKVMREISDIKNVPSEAEEAFAVMVDVALADGEIEPAEFKVLENIARTLGLRLEDFGVQAA